MPTFDPGSWMDLIAYLIVGVPATIAALATWRSQKGSIKIWARHESSQKEVLNEVKNDHATNLRDDIDGLADAINKGFANTNEHIHNLNKHIHGLRVDIQTERSERIEGDKK